MTTNLYLVQSLLHLNENAKKEVDRLTKIAQRDYPYVNHFITLGGWPDDLKAEGFEAFFVNSNMQRFLSLFVNPTSCDVASLCIDPFRLTVVLCTLCI